MKWNQGIPQSRAALPLLRLHFLPIYVLHLLYYVLMINFHIGFYHWTLEGRGFILFSLVLAGGRHGP